MMPDRTLDETLRALQDDTPLTVALLTAAILALECHVLQ